MNQLPVDSGKGQELASPVNERQLITGDPNFFASNTTKMTFNAVHVYDAFIRVSHGIPSMSITEYCQL